MTDHYEEILDALAHEIWAAAQPAPGEGIVDGVARIAALLRKGPHPAITHCDKCGCDWLDNGLNPVGCPYCKLSAETEASRRTPTKEVDFFTPGARLALELECLLLDTRDAAVQSRWWDSAHEALEQWRQAVRDMDASIDAVQPEASTTLNEAESHAHICAKLAEEHKDDVLVCVALTDAAAIIRDLMRSRLQASKSAQTAWQRGFQQGLESNRGLAAQAKEALKKEREAHDVTMKEAGIILSHALLAKIYEAMSALAEQPNVKPKRTVTYVCPVCAASLERQE